MEQNINNKKKHTGIWIGIIVLGIILIVIGAICGRAFYSESSDKKENYSQNFDSVDIQNIKVDSGLMNLRVERSQDDIKNIGVNGTNLIKNRLKCEVRNGTLTIEYKKKRLLDFIDTPFLDGGNNIADANITITLPNKEFRKIDIDGGVGTTEIDDITVAEFDFDGGVGENTLTNLNVSRNADMSLGVGKTSIVQSSFNNSDIDVGVGKFDFSGKLNGDTDIDSGVGSVTMDIDGYKLDYNINYDKGVGDVEINGSNIESTNEKHKIDIDCGVGEVNLNFKGSNY